MLEINFAITFFYGFVVGLSPCILLMLSSFGTSLLLTEKKKDFFQILLGLILGMISAYIVISIIFLPFTELLALYEYTKFVFAGILIFLGIWQILESQKEKSVIFGTPTKVRTILKDFIEKRSGYYSFLVGILFVFIKIPCFGSIYLSLIYELHSNPMLFLYIVVYLFAMVLPVIIILSLIRFGLESSKVNEYRLKYRSYLRILSGGILIFLAIYLLIF
ncbi:MAG: hypothetical protein EAX89_03925 [Candidatus Lokiarchaeota archaeon]|nr:hypothetical protein [Candidatus Lokiarchaeota archaeon]